QSGIRSRLNWLKSFTATGSSASITLEDERMNFNSHSRLLLSVTPLRSGPTLVPLPNVWHAIQRLRKMSFGAAGSGPANAGAADDRTAGRASAGRTSRRQ